MVSLERARNSRCDGDAARPYAKRGVSRGANNPGVARVAFSQLIALLENNKFDTRLRD